MATEIQMPELAADMEEADLLSWLVKPGDHVDAGDLIAEIETDKSTVEFESPVSGTLVEIRVPEGTNGVPIGAVLAIIEEDAGTESAERAPPDAPEPSAPTEPATPPPSEASPAPAEPAPAASATALARRIAQQAGLDLRSVPGTGQGGRVLKTDVQAALAGAAASAPERKGPASPASAPAGAPAVERTRIPHEALPHSRMRRTIAARLAEAKRTVPHFYLRVECEIDRLLELRARFNESDGPLPGPGGLSLNDFVVRAAALALVEVPEANVAWSEEALLRFERVDVAVAVATDGGLLTPVVRDADRKELSVLSAEIRDLAARAREGRLRPDEYRGGTFTVSNLGMYGIESVYPILNPPQACILGVGAGEQRPVVHDGRVEIATVMTCTLSADHRALDGAVGARLLGAVKQRIEDPLEMLL